MPNACCFITRRRSIPNISAETPNVVVVHKTEVDAFSQPRNTHVLWPELIDFSARRDTKEAPPARALTLSPFWTHRRFWAHNRSHLNVSCLPTKHDPGSSAVLQHYPSHSRRRRDSCYIRWSCPSQVPGRGTYAYCAGFLARPPSHHTPYEDLSPLTRSNDVQCNRKRSIISRDLIWQLATHTARIWGPDTTHVLIPSHQPANMLDRATRYKNAANQIQERERKKPGQVQVVDVPDNTQERQVKGVAPPALALPTDEEFWATDQQGNQKPNPEFLREHFFHEGRLTEDQALALLRLCRDVLASEPNVLRVKSPVTVVGDIHGQYYDLMKILEVGGKFSETNYLFLGDYVDRGCFGIECLLYLYALKLWNPDRLFLLRGNHECRHLTEYFTFKRECLHKYSERVYDACIDSFCALPVAGLLDGKFFCVHGGISPELNTVSDIDRIHRFMEPASTGLLCDLLWSDPVPNFGHEHEPSSHASPVPRGQLFGNNTTRGCSFYFTYDAVIKFLERNDLLGVIRGHEAQDAGYVMLRRTPTKKFPSVITVFSAPNYLDAYHNRGAVLKYANKSITIRQYHARPHPYWLPNFMDAFTWSLPFVGSKIIEMLLAVLSVCSPEELEDEPSSSEDDAAARAIMNEATSSLSAARAARREQIKNKIRAVGRMQVMFQNLREGSENASEFNIANAGMDGPRNMGTRDGMDALGVQGNQIRRYIHSFDDARRLDIANERLPEFVDPASFPSVAVPSMRQRTQRPWGSGNNSPTGEGDVSPVMSPGGSAPVPGGWPVVPSEDLNRRRMAEGAEDGRLAERMVERIAHGRRASDRPGS